MSRQPSQAKTRHRIAWQLLLGTLIQLNRIDLSGAQTVVTQQGPGCVGVDHYSYNSDPLLALLNCKMPEVLVKLVNTGGEGMAVMAEGIEQLLFKHALPRAQYASRFAKRHWA